MSGIHTNLVSEARTLITDILSASTDSIEKGLSRTENRIAGALIGFLVAGVPAGICFSDASTDEEKLQKIKAKLINLETAALDNNSPDYQKAISARNFQKEVYENVERYTLTAQKIKNITGVGAFLFSIGVTIGLAGSQFPNVQAPNLELARTIAINTGRLIALPSAAYGLYHWMSEGTKLDGAKQALAKQALNQLSV